MVFFFSCRQAPQFDMKCIDACWYCSGKCDHCMERASFDKGPLLGHHVYYNVERFCNEECLRHYHFHKNSSYTKVHFHTKINPSVDQKHFLSLSCGLLDANLRRNRVEARLYLDYTSQDCLMVYILLQIRFIPTQRFLAFVSSDDLTPITTLPSPSPLTYEDLLLITGFSLILKGLLTELNFDDFCCLASSFIVQETSTPLPEQSVELPPLKLSIEYLPIGFKISEEDRAITCPDHYCVIFHKTGDAYATCLLADPKANIQQEFLALIYHHSVDCVVKIVYAVEDNPIMVKRLESQPTVNSYDEVLVECCRKIVFSELTSMLQLSGVHHLGLFVTNYK